MAEDLGSLFGFALNTFDVNVMDARKIHDTRIIEATPDGRPPRLDQIQSAVYCDREVADVCLNCTAMSCKWGNCQKVKDVERMVLKERRGRRGK